MKKYNQSTTLKSLVTATAALGLIAVPLAHADKDKPLNIDGQSPLDREVTETFVDGYTVPAQYQTYFMELPASEKKHVAVRYHQGHAYYVNENDWKIVRVVNLDPSMKMVEEDSVMVAGYVIPEERRTRFIDLPAPEPESKLSVRYYNNTAYYMDPSFRIVRTMSLKR